MKYITQSEVLKVLSPAMRIVFYKELELGNEMKEACYGGFSDEEWLHVFMKKPVHNFMDIEGVHYLELNDPHYWTSEINDLKNKQTIAG